jgi:AraC-like DNA-binding protein
MNPESTTASPAPAGIPQIRFSTGDFPERDRIPLWRESLGREVMRLELEPLGELPFQANFTAPMLEGLGVVFGTISPVRVGRTRTLLADGDDSLIMHMLAAPAVASQFGREVALAPHEAVVLSNADVGAFTCPATSQGLALRLSRGALQPLVRDPGKMLVRSIPKDSAALKLLKHHLSILLGATLSSSVELQQVFVTHAYDLIALALGATRDAAETANGRGLRAARLCAIKDDIRASLLQPDLSAGVVARRHGISPRYLRLLFESEQTSFTDFVRAQRLARAHRLLTNPRHDAFKISAIAYDAGFSDLSHFNRAFRRAYGMTPSDVRAGAARKREP